VLGFAVNYNAALFPGLNYQLLCSKLRSTEGRRRNSQTSDKTIGSEKRFLVLGFTKHLSATNKDKQKTSVALASTRSPSPR
jgi:hypothetical protein